MQVKERIFYVIMAVLLVLTGVFGSLAIVAPADEAQAQQFTACYEEFGGAKRVASSGCEFEFQSGATLDIQSGTTVTYKDVTESGPTRFGTASNVISGTLIAHGIGTTPTAVLLTPQYSGAFSQTVYVLATNATSFTVAISSGSVVTVTTVNWLAGK